MRNSYQDPHHILKNGDKMTLYQPAPGNWSGDKMTLHQPAPENWIEVRTFKSQGQGWNSTICKSPTIDNNKKVFKNLLQQLNLAEEAPVICIEAMKTNILIW